MARHTAEQVRRFRVCECREMAFATLTQGFVAFIDPDDVPKVGDRSWNAAKSPASTKWYAQRSNYGGSPRILKLHRAIMNASSKQLIDHRDGNTFDNRKHNLRQATKAKNNMNAAYGHGTSKFKGVCWKRDIGRWRAYIKIDQKQVSLGVYDDEMEAAKAYDRKALELFGEFALTNQMLGRFS